MLRYEPHPHVVGNDLLVIPYVDLNEELPEETQTPLQWLRNGEWLGGATSATLNDGELNRTTVLIQRNVAVVNTNTFLNKKSIDACIELVNIHEDILNAGGIDLPLYERVSKIELDIGKVPTGQTYRTVRAELLFQKSMLGNYTNFNLDDEPTPNTPSTGVKKKLEDGNLLISQNASDIAEINVKIGDVDSGIVKSVEDINLDLYGTGSGKPSLGTSLLSKVNGTKLDASYEGLGCFDVTKLLYDDYTTNGFTSDLPFGSDNNVSYTRARVNNVLTWIPVGSFPIKLSSSINTIADTNIISSVGNLLTHGSASSTHIFNGVVTQNLVFGNGVGVSCTDSVGNVSDVLLMLTGDTVSVGSSGYSTTLNTTDNVLISVNGAVGSKVWCDANSEAPKDNRTYARNDGAWTRIDQHTYGTSLPDDGDGELDGHVYFQIVGTP